MSKKYRIDENEIHRKRLGKHTLSKRIVSFYDITESHMGGYHYTSPEGLKGILETRTLFFTDCEYLNDTSERLNINKTLDKFWYNERKYYDREFYNLIKNIRLTNYTDSGFSYLDNDFDSNTKCRYFVLSCSNDDDSLNMWKYYSKGNEYNGYCISLFGPALTDEWIDRETSVAIEEGDVVYFEDEKIKRIRTTVEKLYELWCLYQRNQNIDDKIISEFRSWIQMASLFFKDDHFFGEEEYRYVAIVPEDRLNYLNYSYKNKTFKMYDFRIVNGTFIPYIKMPFNFYHVDECYAIESIRVGPSEKQEQKAKSIERLIQSLDYDMKIGRILYSNIPLRY